MKKVLLVALLAIGVSAASYAQGGPGGFGRTPAEQTEALKTSLSLTADQVTKVTAIMTAQTKSMDSLRTAIGDDFQSMFSKMTPIQAKYNAQIKALLTADQAKIYQKQLDERAERMKQFMPQN